MKPYLIGILLISTAVLFIALAAPLAMGRVPRNPYYGFRIAKAFESEQNWYQINRHGGIGMIIWSVPILIIGVGSLRWPPMTRQGFLLCGLSTLLILVPILRTCWWSRKL
jgi:SdpI/YfhL protein family